MIYEMAERRKQLMREKQRCVLRERRDPERRKIAAAALCLAARLFGFFPGF